MISRAERRVELRPVARREVIDAFDDRYEEQSTGLGLEFVRAVRATVANLRKTPEMFPKVHGEIRRALLRRFPYAVFYRETTDAVIVLGVVHTHRDPQVWQSRT